MHLITRLSEFIQSRLDVFLKEQQRSLEELGDDHAPMFDAISRFLTGGKRLRGQFLALGFLAVDSVTDDEPVSGSPLARIVDAACALELFHAAALIHDDLIDQSDTRRGNPSIHRAFAAQHAGQSYRGDPERYGQAIAILAGDLLQSWADELMQETLDSLPDSTVRRVARAHFNRMRSEVAIGQFLDVLEEQLPAFADHEEQLERSTRVLVYKSAKYSVQAPLLIGATMAGASPEQTRALSNFGLPTGVAFQLRDDVLGVFGDEQVTGKPSGDDLTEGKRTVLVTLAREQLPPSPKRLFDELHGTADLNAEQVAMLQRTIRDTGALERVERMIQSNVGIAREALADADLNPEAVRALIRLAEFVADRSA